MTANWASEAAPKSLVDAGNEPWCPGVVDAAIARGITKVVHFTRTRGLVGILHDSAVKARSDLPFEEHLKHVYQANAADRSRDLIWHGYVNMSVSSINSDMFAFSRRQHPDDEWVILEFGPEILGDPGVVFCTTNNAYEVAHRASGLEGFDQLFAPLVPWGHYGSRRNRASRSTYQTTDPQAEVLYPYRLPLEHLQTIVVGDEDTLETVQASLSHFPHAANIKIEPEAFK